MELNLHVVMRKYWYIQFAEDSTDYLGPVGIVVDKDYSSYAHELLLLEEDNDGGTVFRIRRRTMAYTFNESPVIKLEPIGEGLYRSTDLIYLPWDARELGHYLERKGLLAVIPSEAYAILSPPEDAAVIFVRHRENLLEEAVACGYAYAANALYPKEYTELLPNPRPVVFYAYYSRGKGTSIGFYDKQTRERLGITRYFPGFKWAEAESLSELLYYINRGLGYSLPQRNLDRYFTALAVRAYADMA